MKHILLLLITLLPLSQANANDQTVRIFRCKGDSARMEVYGPKNPAESLSPMRSAKGWYLLDLSGANKGVHSEPVLLSLSRDGAFVIMDRYTLHRIAYIPINGGHVDFDNRFGFGANCKVQH